MSAVRLEEAVRRVFERMDGEPGYLQMLAPMPEAADLMLRLAAPGLEELPHEIHEREDVVRTVTTSVLVGIAVGYEMRSLMAREGIDVALRSVSRDFAGAHVNAGSTVGAVRRALREEGLVW